MDRYRVSFETEEASWTCKQSLKNAVENFSASQSYIKIVLIKDPRVKVLVKCHAGRYNEGDRGVLLKNDSEKYHYKVFFGYHDEFELLGKTITESPKIYYFHEHEIEIMEKKINVISNTGH